MDEAAADVLEIVTDERLVEFPESARTVVTLLALDGPLTLPELTRQVDLSERTVLRRLRQLRQAGLVRRRVDSRDSRRVRYGIADR